MPDDHSDVRPPEALTAGVRDGLCTFPAHVRAWIEAHVCIPRIVTVHRYAPALGRDEALLRWLVTAPTGLDDSRSRVYFDADTGLFELGHEHDGQLFLFHGFSGSFSEAVSRVFNFAAGAEEFESGIRTYVVTAYRWGSRELVDETYLVYVGVARETAKLLATEEHDNRGGKYAIEIVEYSGMVDEDGPLGTVIHYSSSAMDPQPGDPPPKPTP